MAIGGLTSSGSTASLADTLRAWRTGAVSAAQQVKNQLDRPDQAQIEDEAAYARQLAAARSQAKQSAKDDAARGSFTSGGNGDGSGANSAFLTQALAQEQSDTADRAAAVSGSGGAGQAASAYAATADRAASLSGSASEPQQDILIPETALSSGRRLDLSV